MFNFDSCFWKCAVYSLKTNSKHKIQNLFLTKSDNSPPQNFRTATLKRLKIGDEDFSKHDF
jgi:hypothetical protein